MLRLPPCGLPPGAMQRPPMRSGSEGMRPDRHRTNTHQGAILVLRHTVLMMQLWFIDGWMCRTVQRERRPLRPKQTHSRCPAAMELQGHECKAEPRQGYRQARSGPARTVRGSHGTHCNSWAGPLRLGCLDDHSHYVSPICTVHELEPGCLTRGHTLCQPPGTAARCYSHMRRTCGS